MKWMIAADIHGFTTYLRALFEAFDREKADRIVLLGDLWGMGGETMERIYHERRDEITAVRGNCDPQAARVRFGFPMPEYTTFSAFGKLFMATHGHLYDESFLPDGPRPDVLLLGHTHVPRCEEINGILCCNPGSVSLPRGGSRQSYMTMEGGTLCWKTLEGECFFRHTVQK